jgi:hypothetical protein
LTERYSCTPVCHILIVLEASTSAIGPAGDVLYLPLRITGGTLTGMGPEKRIICGTDFAEMYADEKLVHNGNLVVADPAGDILIWYDGTSQAREGAYDDLLEGKLPESATTRLSIRTISTNPAWRALNKKPLLGIGSFSATATTLELTLLSLTENEALNLRLARSASTR